ncbi:helix-turn-helix transcriptional regulator [bacterium]|nr:helix-turn-helix transcriptional regulator [bacterium]
MSQSILEKAIAEIPISTIKFVEKQGEIASQIATILKSKKSSQRDFAKQIGMKESQLSKILAADANLTLKTITKIEAALEQDIIQIPMFTSQSLYDELIYHDNSDSPLANIPFSKPDKIMPHNTTELSDFPQMKVFKGAA